MYKSKNVRVESPASPLSPSPQENLETSVRSVETVSPLMPSPSAEAANKSVNDRSNQKRVQNSETERSDVVVNNEQHDAHDNIEDKEPEIINVNNLTPSNATADHHHQQQHEHQTMHLPNIIDIAQEMADFDTFSLFPRTRLQEAVRDAHLFAARDELWRDMASSFSSSRPSEWFTSIRAFTMGNNFNSHFTHMERHRERHRHQRPVRETLFSFNNWNSDFDNDNYGDNHKPIVDENVNDANDDNNNIGSKSSYTSRKQDMSHEEEEENGQPVEDVIPISNVAQTRQSPLFSSSITNSSELSSSQSSLPHSRRNLNNNKKRVDIKNKELIFNNQSTFAEQQQQNEEWSKENKEALRKKVDATNFNNKNNNDKDYTEMSAKACNERRVRMFLFDEITPEQTVAMASVNNDCIATSDPFTCELPARCEYNHRHGWIRRWLPCGHSVHGSSILYNLSRTLYVQLILFIFYVLCTVVVFTQIFSGRGSARWLTTYVSVIYLIDLLIVCSYMKLARFKQLDQYWHIAEPFVMVLLFILECLAWEMWDVVHYSSTVGFRILASVRFVLWVLHSRTRWEQLIISLRCFCSADRRRYQANGFDLDLSFIHRNIVAMAWPANNFEKYFRNPFREVAFFFDTLYPNAYCAINLSSERTYHPSLFHHHTAWYAMDDHNPIEMETLLNFCQFCSNYIACDPYSRVVAVHCKGGKGRTGTMIASLLMYMGLAHNAEQALHHFAVMRTIYGKSTFQGVQAPSQARYVRYFEKLLSLEQCVQHNSTNEHEEHICIVPHRTRKITSLWLRNVPPLWCIHGIGKLWFAIIIKPSSQREVVFLSNDTVTFNPAVPEPSTYTAKQFKDLFALDEDNFYHSSNVIESDNEINVTNDNETTHTQSTDTTHQEQTKRFALDTTSFWYHVEEKQEIGVRQTRMDYKAFTNFVQNKLQIMQHHGVEIIQHNTNTNRYYNRSSWYKNARKIWAKLKNKIYKNNDNEKILNELSKEFNVTLEFKEPNRLPIIDDDVVFKFFYSRNNPNPLEVPVQFWFHTFFEQTDLLEFACDELDGPSRDIKHERYPANFAVAMTLEDVSENDLEHYDENSLYY